MNPCISSRFVNLCAQCTKDDKVVGQDRFFELDSQGLVQDMRRGYKRVVNICGWALVGHVDCLTRATVVGNFAGGEGVRVVQEGGMF